MGDMLSLIEDAQNRIDAKKAEKMAEKLTKNKMDLNDLLDQINQVRKMGPLKSLLGKLPGVDKQIQNIVIDERQIDRMCAIILSMTKEEREKPSIISLSRKKRIANGSGMQVEDVNKLLKRFEQTQKMMKKMKGKGKKRVPKTFLPGLGGTPGGFPF